LEQQQVELLVVLQELVLEQLVLDIQVELQVLD
jgi:hypothetical protein